MSENIKTVETEEIFAVATVLNAYLMRGVYNLSYKDIVNAAAGALSGLKEETFRRWLRNPMWLYDKYSGTYKFRYGMKPKVFTSPASDFGLELILYTLGVAYHVRWLRIWTSHFAVGEKSNEEERQHIIAMLDDFVRECRQAWRASGDDKMRTLSYLSEQFRTKILPECCAYRGCHGILTQPVIKGKKTIVYIPRSRIVPNAVRRMEFKSPDNDIMYV